MPHLAPDVGEGLAPPAQNHLRDAESEGEYAELELCGFAFLLSYSKKRNAGRGKPLPYIHSVIKPFRSRR